MPDAITSSGVWADWLNLSNQRFSDIQNKIRQRRKMYKLDWIPGDMDARSAKRWQDYLIDPLPRNDIDFKSDRLTMRPLQIRIPTDQLTIDTVDLLNNNDAFQGLNANTDLMQLSRKLKDVGREMAQKRADSIEKFLNGTLYINMMLRKINLPLKWSMHMLVDGFAGYMVYYDASATADEYPIVLRALDPLMCVYTRGDQKLDKFIVGRQDTVFNLREEFGGSLFAGRAENDIIHVLDYWKRIKVTDPTAESGYKPEVWHCTYLGATGISGDPFITGVGPDKSINDKSINKMATDAGWALTPTKTDYFEIPGDMIEARVTPLTEDPDQEVASDLDASYEIWNGRNYFLTRLNRLAKLGSGSDLITKGITGDVLQHLGKGEGATVQIPADATVNPQDAISWSKPPPSDPNTQMLDLALNQMLQQSLIPITSLGNRGGTVSGAQVDQLDQGSAVRLQTFINAMNLLHTSWCRSAMQIASIFYKDPSKSIPVFGMDRNSSPFATKISAADINGDYTVFAECNTKTNMELLQEALTALKLTSPDPTQAILSKQTVRENYLNLGYNWQEEERIKREAIEFNENQIKVTAQKAITDAQLQVINNLENIRVQSILQGVPPNPLVMQMMQIMQNSLLQGMTFDDSQGQSPSSPPSQPNFAQQLQMPTNEGYAQAAAPTETGNIDQRQVPQAPNNFQANAARNGLALPNGTYQ
jgi:hypothetical protein